MLPDLELILVCLSLPAKIALIHYVFSFTLSLALFTAYTRYMYSDIAFLQCVGHEKMCKLQLNTCTGDIKCPGYILTSVAVASHMSHLKSSSIYYTMIYHICKKYSC